MIDGRQAFLRSLGAAFFALVAALGFAAQADGLKISEKPKKTSDIPEAGSNVEDISARFGKGSGESSSGPSFDVPQSQQPNNTLSPAAAKKWRELADKEKNWLVHSMTEDGKKEQDPANKDTKSELDDAFLEKKTKTSNERFFEEKDGKGKPANSKRENRDDPERQSRDPKDNSDFRKNGEPDAETVNELNINNYLNPGGSREGGFQMREEGMKSPFRAGFTGFERNNISDPAKAARDRAEMDRLSAFRKLLQSPGIGGAGIADPLAAPTDLTRQTTQPVTPQRSLAAEASPVLTPFANGAGATFRIDKPSSSIESAARLSSAPSLTPSFGAAFSPVNLPSASNPKAFEMEVPRRKF